MSYITKANAMKIVTTSLNNVNKLNGNIYKPMKIYFFSKYEKNQLLAIKQLLQNPEKYFTEVYKRYNPIDTFKYVYEGSKPSYHDDLECGLMYSDMINYEIPEDIIEKGERIIEEFRSWFRRVEYLLIDEKPDVFVARLRARWGIITNVNAINFNNSGIERVNNLKINELERMIDNKIKEAGRYYYASEKNRKILSKFSRISFVANKDEIYGNNTGYGDEEVRELLLNYNKKYKNPIKKDLVHYYKLKYNPNIEMRGSFLDQVGFKSCSSCHSSN